jgi:hypothetical protein
MAAGAAGSLPGRRPDQRRTAPIPGLLPPPNNNDVLARIIVIYGSGLIGLFQYSGTPGSGNPPILYSVPPGVSTDPYGNALPVTGGGIYSAVYSGGVPQAESGLQGGGVLLYGGAASGYFAAAGMSISGADKQSLVINSASINGVSDLFAFLELVTVVSPAVPYVLVGNGSTLLVASVGPPATAAQAEIAGYLALKDQAAPASVAGWTEPYATASGNLGFVSGSDGNSYSTGSSRVNGTATPQLINSAGNTTITGLTRAMAAGVTYRFRVMLTIANGASNLATVKVNLNCSGGFSNTLTINTTTVIPAQMIFAPTFAAGSALASYQMAEQTNTNNFGNTTSAMGTVSGQYTMTIAGDVESAAGGTFAVQLAEGVAGDAFTVEYATLDLEPIS